MAPFSCSAPPVAQAPRAALRAPTAWLEAPNTKATRGLGGAERRQGGRPFPFLSLSILTALGLGIGLVASPLMLPKAVAKVDKVVKVVEVTKEVVEALAADEGEEDYSGSGSGDYDYQGDLDYSWVEGGPPHLSSHLIPPHPALALP